MKRWYQLNRYSAADGLKIHNRLNYERIWFECFRTILQAIEQFRDTDVLKCTRFQLYKEQMIEEYKKKFLKQ